MLLGLHTTPININLIQVNTPTAGKDETTIEEFYKQLEQFINKHEIKIIIDDFNGKGGKRNVSNAVGKSNNTI